jgi:hypothetical protein
MRYLKTYIDFNDPLNEIVYGHHWHHRTSYPGEDQSFLSRILPFSPADDKNNPEGFQIDHFVDEEGEYFEKSEALSILEIDEDTANNYITHCLRNLTRSKKLENWESKSKAFYLMLNLGSIRFYNDPYSLYPLIKGGRKKEGGFFDPGDQIWGLAKENNDKGTISMRGATIKYYPYGPAGTLAMKLASREESDVSIGEFTQKSYIDYPYGNDFEITVDLSNDEDMEVVKEKIDSQVK